MCASVQKTNNEMNRMLSMLKLYIEPQHTHTHRIMCTCLYNEIRNGFPYRPQKISRKCSFAVSMRTSIQTISSDRMPWYGSSWSIDDLQKHRARESVRKREKKWISFKPPEILIWASKRAAATTSTAKLFPYGDCVEYVREPSRFLPYGGKCYAWELNEKYA